MSSNSEKKPTAAPKRARKSGGGTRLWMGSQVLLSVALAGIAVLLINYLAARPGVRLRVDTTAKDVNSLDPSTERILKNLPEEVTVDVFFRPMPAPLTQLVAQVQSRTQALLQIMEAVSSDRLRVRQNDLSDYTAVQERMQELRLRGLENAVVVSSGDQVKAVRLIGGLATFSGNPDPNNYQKPMVRSFEAETSIQKAILSVTRGARPHVYFTSGHGESDPYEMEQESIGILESALRADGFVIHTWNPIEDGDLPEEASLVAMVGPTDTVAPATLKRLERFAAEGGRLLIAPHPDAGAMKTSGLDEWVGEFGFQVTEGTVMEPHPDPAGTGALIVGPHSALFPIHPNHMKRHEIVQPFIDAGRSFVALHTHAVKVVKQPQGTGFSMPLYSSNAPVSWLDTYPLNYRHDGEMEVIQSYDLAAVSEYTDEQGGQGTDGEERIRTRIVLLGSAACLYNATLESKGASGSSLDFARNTFNWLASREWRVNVSPKDPDLRILEADKIQWVSRLAMWGLPLLCLFCGFVVAFRRSRGGPGRRPATETVSGDPSGPSADTKVSS